MNTQLEKLFLQYNLSEKDQYEIKQIYALLPMHKQNNVLQNFGNIASKLIQIEEDIREEREILVNNEVDLLFDRVIANRKESTIENIKKLRKEI